MTNFISLLPTIIFCVTRFFFGPGIRASNQLTCRFRCGSPFVVHLKTFTHVTDEAVDFKKPFRIFIASYSNVIH